MSSRIFKIIWLIGIYSILGIILYLVVEYKVEWENKDLNTYLYFYDCNDNLCTSPTVQKEYYNRIVCEDNICPYITNIINNNVILSDTTKSWIYDYKNNEIIDNKYKNYKLIENDHLIITNEQNLQGIIDLSGNIIIEPNYNKIYSYTKDILLYKENNIYKIKNNDNIYELNEEFTDVIIINNNLFAAKKDNQYNIYHYNNLEKPYTKQTYNYIYTYKNIILTISNKKMDILTTNLDSTLLMKIDTYYEYTTEKERGSLAIKTDETYIYFNVFKSNNEYTTYKFNIIEKKLV